jgi:hypothetical protein
MSIDTAAGDRKMLVWPKSNWNEEEVRIRKK